MTNYYAYRNWAIRLGALLFGDNKVCAFDLNTGKYVYSIADKRDTHASIARCIDRFYGDATDYFVGFPGLVSLSPKEKMMIAGLFEHL